MRKKFLMCMAAVLVIGHFTGCRVQEPVNGAFEDNVLQENVSSNQIEEEGGSNKLSEQNASEEEVVSKAREYAKYYLNVEMGEEFDVKVLENSEVILFIHKQNKELFTSVYFNKDGSLWKLCTTIQNGSFEEYSEEEKKEAALKYLVEKEIIESEGDVTFVETDEQANFTNFYFKNVDGQELGVGISLNSCDVLAFWGIQK